MTSNWEYDYSTLYREQPPESQRHTAPEPYPLEQDGGAPKAPRGKKRWGRRILACLLALAVCAGTGVAGGYFGYRLAANAAPGSAEAGPVLYQTVDRTGTSVGEKGTLSVQDVAGVAASSVVEVTTEQVVTGGYFSQRVQSGAGSGVIISEDGYIITNAHVVSGATHVKVRLADKSEYEAQVVGSDDSTDVAVLKIDASGLTPAVMGDSEKLAVGELVVAIGNPLGNLGGTVTDGIVSALDRDINVQGRSMRLLQHSAAISPGNSGGGLFNGQGELIGIVNAKSSQEYSEGLGFAIPINTARKVAEDLIRSGYVTGRPALGITVLNVQDEQTAAQYGMNSFGVYIMQVNPGSGAEKAGLKPGDRIVSMEGREITTTQDVGDVLQAFKVGDRVELQVVRDGRVYSFKVQLGEMNGPAQVPAPDSIPEG